MAAKAERYGEPMMRMAEKTLLLQILDHLWKEHLLHLDHLRQGIHLRGYAQRDPLNEYKREAFDLFEAMLTNLRQTVTQVLSHLEIRMQEPPPPPPPAPAPIRIAAAQPARSAAMAMPEGELLEIDLADPVELGQGAAQRTLPVRLGQEVQAVPWADRLAAPDRRRSPMNPLADRSHARHAGHRRRAVRRPRRASSSAARSTSATATG